MRLRLPLMLAALALVPLALYARAATFEYVQADDTDLIRGNIAFLQDLGNAGATFGRSYFETAAARDDRKTYYRPLVILSFMLDAQAGGAEPRVYHVTNAAIHAAVVLLLFAFLRTLGANDLPAFLTAMLFAVHPANVQAVAWIPGRNDTLMAAFALLSIIALVRHVRTRRPSWLVLHVGAFAASLFVKESALALVVLFVICAGLLHEPGRPRPRLRSVLLLDLAAAGVWYAMRRTALAGSTGLSLNEYVTAALWNAPDLLVYVGKMIFPVHLSVTPGATPLDLALGVAAAALLFLMLARNDSGRRRLILAWLLLFLVPALTIPGLPAYEHRLYFPLIGVLVGVAALPVWRDTRRRWMAVTAMVVGQAVFAALAFTHSGVFHDRHSYWTSATASPYAGIAHVNLGQIAESDGDLARAAHHYRAALAADPATPGAHNNLGVLAARRGNADEARAEFEREVARHPANADAYFNLGLVEKFSNRMAEAAAWWERTVAVDPSHAAAHEELAAYYTAKGDGARAARHREAARR